MAEQDTQPERSGRARLKTRLNRISGAFGLRGRLLLGLTVVGLTLTVSVGYVVLWAVERQLRLNQQRTASQMADTASALCSASFRLNKKGLRHPLIRNMVTGILRRILAVPGTVQVVLTDGRGGRVVLGDVRGIRDPAKDPTIRSTLRAADIRLRRMDRGPNHPRGAGTDLVLYRRVSGPGGPAALRVTYAAETAVAALMRRAKTSVWILAGLDVVLLLVLAGIFLTRAVIGPIKELEGAARKVASGRLDQQVEVRGEAEIGRLAEAFNTMTEQLRQNEATLRSQIRQLEKQQRELDASWDHVIRAEKFASVGRLAAGVAHEVGNPLTALLGYVEILKDSGGQEGEQAEFLDRMERELKRMDSIIHGLLDYSRQEQEPVKPTALRDVARTAAELVKPQKTMKDVDVRLKLPEDLPLVQVSGEKLIQVFVNLLLNSGDAMDGKGQVTVQAERPGSGAETIGVEFRDTGPGMSKEIRDKVFDPFFTTKEVGQGTGLGLSICLSILQTMDGSIELMEPQPERGAGFRILLKLAGPGEEASDDTSEDTPDDAREDAPDDAREDAPDDTAGGD